MFIVHRAHCSRQWMAEVEENEGLVQVTLEAKLINILTWNFDFLNSFLFYFVQELINPVLFVHCGCYNQKFKYPSCKSTCLWQTTTRIYQILVIAATEYKKHWIFQNLQKIE